MQINIRAIVFQSRCSKRLQYLRPTSFPHQSKLQIQTSDSVVLNHKGKQLYSFCPSSKPLLSSYTRLRYRDKTVVVQNQRVICRVRHNSSSHIPHSQKLSLRKTCHLSSKSVIIHLSLISVYFLTLKNPLCESLSFSRLLIRGPETLKSTDFFSQVFSSVSSSRVTASFLRSRDHKFSKPIL